MRRFSSAVATEAGPPEFPGDLAIVQPLPGIGDMIWHLPHVAALAARASGRVTLVAKASSRADRLLARQSAVGEVLWLDKLPPGRGPSALRLAGVLRSRRFAAAVLLHHSRGLAFSLLAAGIPRRYGYGFTWQRALLNRPPFLPHSMLHQPRYDQATAWLTACGITLADPEPRIAVPEQARAAACARVGHARFPAVALGLGSSEPFRRWSNAAFAEVASALLVAGWRSVLLLGGPGEASVIDDLLAQLGPHAARAIPVIGWPIDELAALLAASALHLGNDSGFLNLAAAVGTRAYGLFGATPPLHHSRQIVPIQPPDRRPDLSGMQRITPDAVLGVIAADRGTLGPLPHAAEA